MQMNPILQSIANDPNIDATFRAAIKEQSVTYATCPKCNGTARMPPWDSLRKYLPMIAGYRVEDDTIACDNCCTGMNPRRDGMTKVDPATGLGCMHQFKGVETRNCYTVYTCSKCGSRHDIDSGD